MTDMERWVFPLGVERKPAAEGDSRIKYVLASDAEDAISAAKQRHSDEDGLMQAQAFDYGERHMLAKCIEVVDAERKWWRDTHFGTTHLVAGEWNDSLQNVLAVLRGLEEKP